MRTLPAGLLFLFAACHAAAEPVLTLSPVPTIHTGTRYAFSVKVAKDAADSGPFQIHVVLPDGMAYQSSQTGYWSCAGTTPGAQEVDCTSLVTTPPSTTFSVYTDTSPDMTPGPATITATIESAQYPLPSPPDCQPTPSTTGCATATTTVEASSLTVYRWNPYDGAVVVWDGPPWVAGETRQLALQIQNIGYGQYGGQVIARVELPPGVSYAGRPNIACSAEGQVVTCVPAQYAVQITNVYFDVALPNDIPVPGPIEFHAAISNDVQQQTLAQCRADPYQVGCGRLSVPTRGPRTAYLRFKTPDGATHSPNLFVLGRENGPIQLAYENIGDGNAAATTVAVKLPPGFDNLTGITGNSNPAPTCSTSGDVDAGLILVCTGNGVPSGASGWLRFNVTPDATTEAPGPVVLLGAIDSSSPANLDTLIACASDPDHAHCVWHGIPTYAPCALQYGADGVYCDGFDEMLPFARGDAER